MQLIKRMLDELINDFDLLSQLLLSRMQFFLDHHSSNFKITQA